MLEPQDFVALEVHIPAWNRHQRKNAFLEHGNGKPKNYVEKRRSREKR